MKYIVLALVFTVVYLLMGFFFVIERICTVVYVVFLFAWEFKTPKLSKKYWISFNLSEGDITVKEYWRLTNNVARVHCGLDAK